MIFRSLVLIVCGVFCLGVIEAQTIDDASDPQPPGALIRSGALQNAALHVSITNFDNPEISIFAPTSPQFASFISSVSPIAAESLRPLFPYSVLLRNNGVKSVIAYTMSWTTFDAVGKPWTDYRTVCDALSLKGLILPNSEELITVFGPQGLSASPPDSELVRQISTQAEQFQQGSSINISLQAVMFGDGTTSGPDASLSIPQIKGRIRSEHDLFSAVLTMEQTSVLTWLNEVAGSVKAGSALDLSSDPYDEWFKFYQAKLSRNLLRLAARNGVAAMLASVQAAFNDKNYPPAL